MTSKSPYTALGIIAMIATPLAAAVLFGWEMYTYLLTEKLMPLALAIAGGVAMVIAMESVGIYAGHIGMDYLKRRDWRGIVAAAAMIFYVWYGWSKVPEYGAVFILAAFVYLLVALRVESVAADETAKETAVDQTAWERQQVAEDRRMKHEENLARIAAKAQAQVNAVYATHDAIEPTHTERIPTHDAKAYECTCGKVLTSATGYAAHMRWCKLAIAERVNSNGVAHIG